MAEENNQNQQQQNQQQNQNQQQQTNQQQNQPAGTIDYERLASIVSGKQQVAEDTVLKNYFKQQGLSPEDAQKAMADFKASQAKNQPDINALQTSAQQATEAAKQAMLEKDATLEAISMGVDAKTIPYLLKLADLSNVLDKDGKVNAEAMKAALNKVLEDVPQLKGQPEDNKGFQIGGNGNAGNGNQQNQQQKTNATATKKWNRWNN